MSASSAFSLHCIICFDDFDADLNYPVVLPCGHTYVCINCANRLDRCMECRAPLDVKIGVAPPTEHTTSQRGSSALQLRQQQNRYYGPHQTPPRSPPVIVKQRLPLPKNAVLLSLIQASEPARRRSSVLFATEDDPPLPSSNGGNDVVAASPMKTTTNHHDQDALLESPPLLTKRCSSYHSNDSSAQEQSAGESLLFPSLALPNNQSSDAAKSSIQDTDLSENCNNKANKWMELHPTIQVCGTYAVADIKGLLVYPSLAELQRVGVSASVDNLAGEDLVDQAGEASPIDRNNDEASAVRNVQLEDGEDQVGEASSIDDDHLEGEDNLSTQCNIGLTLSTSASASSVGSNDDEYVRNGLNQTHLDGSNTLSDEKPAFSFSISPVASPKQLDNIAMKERGSNKDDRVIESELTQSLTESSSSLTRRHISLLQTQSLNQEDNKNKEGDDSAIRKVNVPSSAPVQDGSKRPLLRLKYGDRVQVVGSDPRGEWVKLARGYGYIRLLNDKQLVKIGEATDKACKIESTLLELSIERDLLRYEQTKLERLSAGLMIDLQSTLFTSDDHVICAPPNSFLHGTDSDLCDSIRNSCSLDDIDDITIMRAKNDEVPEEAVSTPSTAKAPVFTAKSHSPNQKATLPTMIQPQQVTTPTREVNWRTGLSGHRALTNSQSPHPHDFIGASSSGGAARLMSNHAGVSKSKSRPRASMF
eukprot:scaffold11034_cov155-Skeletonema_dohrnii-CCMP3373.AAC.9